MQAQVQEALEQIKRLPLTKTTRKNQTQYFHFGSTRYTTSQGLILDVGVWVLAADCSWQLQQANGDTINASELYLRKREAGLPTAKFDWKEPGANLRDQRLKEFVNKGNNLTVTQIEQGEGSSLTLNFADNSKLSITPDLTQEQEMYWQFFSNSGDNLSITATPAGIV